MVKAGDALVLRRNPKRKTAASLSETAVKFGFNRASRASVEYSPPRLLLSSNAAQQRKTFRLQTGHYGTNGSTVIVATKAPSPQVKFSLTIHKLMLNKVNRG